LAQIKISNLTSHQSDNGMKKENKSNDMKRDEIFKILPVQYHLVEQYQISALEFGSRNNARNWKH